MSGRRWGCQAAPVLVSVQRNAFRFSRTKLQYSCYHVSKHQTSKHTHYWKHFPLPPWTSFVLKQLVEVWLDESTRNIPSDKCPRGFGHGEACFLLHVLTPWGPPRTTDLHITLSYSFFFVSQVMEFVQEYNLLEDSHRFPLWGQRYPLSLTTMLRFSKPAVLTRRPLTTVPERNNSCYFQSQILRPLTPRLVLIYLFWCHSLSNSRPHLMFTVFHSCSFVLPLVFISQKACLLPSVFFLSHPLSPHISRTTN